MVIVGKGCDGKRSLGDRVREEQEEPLTEYELYSRKILCFEPKRPCWEWMSIAIMSKWSKRQGRTDADRRRSWWIYVTTRGRFLWVAGGWNALNMRNEGRREFQTGGS